MNDPIVYDLVLTIMACGALVGALVLTAILLPLQEEELEVADREFGLWLAEVYAGSRSRAARFFSTVLIPALVNSGHR